LRGSTSNRGMGCVNGCAPNSGLSGNPVGMARPKYDAAPAADDRHSAADA
jgi:hypothetical protein